MYPLLSPPSMRSIFQHEIYLWRDAIAYIALLDVIQTKINLYFIATVFIQADHLLLLSRKFMETIIDRFIDSDLKSIFKYRYF